MWDAASRAHAVFPHPLLHRRNALPVDYPFVNFEVGKKQLGVIVNDLAERYSKVQVANSLDALKEAGFTWATRSGVTVSIEDVVTPESKAQILHGSTSVRLLQTEQRTMRSFTSRIAEIKRSSSISGVRIM